MSNILNIVEMYFQAEGVTFGDNKIFRRRDFLIFLYVLLAEGYSTSQNKTKIKNDEIAFKTSFPFY